MREESRTAALEMMEAVAEGKPEEVILQAAKRAGLQAYFIKVPFLESDYGVRCAAFEMIGSTGLPEALEYLAAVTPERAGHDEIQQVYPAAKVALQKARLRAEPDPARQITFLQGQLAAPIVPQAANWAAEELCDLGDTKSMDRLAQAFKRRDPGPRGKAMVSFCEERMEIVNRDPDRAKALGSVVRADAQMDQERILRWAVDQLLAMKTAEADQILDRYAADVAQRFPKIAETPPAAEGDMHVSLAQEIRNRIRPDR